MQSEKAKKNDAGGIKGLVEQLNNNIYSLALHLQSYADVLRRSQDSGRGI